MGTRYILYKYKHPAEEAKELVIDEHSNLFDIGVTSGDHTMEICDIKPERMIGIALEILKVCSYWTEDDEVERQIAAFKRQGYYW